MLRRITRLPRFRLVLVLVVAVATGLMVVLNTTQAFSPTGEKMSSASKQFTVFEDVTIGPNESHDSITAVDVDGYQYLHYWVSAKHPNNMAMDNITLDVVFELPQLGATGLANLDSTFDEGVVPTAMTVSSGPPTGGYGSFVVRVPIVGPAARVIVYNGGTETYQFSVYGYATR